MTDEHWPTAEGRLSGRVDLDGREMIMLSSNDYLGLAGDERVLAGARRALDAYGTGIGLNPSIALTRVHRELADELAAYLGCESVLLFNSCAAANCATLQTLADTSETTIVSDEYNHASIVDGCRLARGRTRVYRHDDLGSLEELSADLTSADRTLVVTDGVFSMEGSVARLDELQPLATRLGAELVVDDSHGIGVIGPTGRGSVEHHGTAVSTVRTGTFAKALGAGLGGFLAGPAEVVDEVRSRGRFFIFTSPMPPSSAGAAVAAIRLIGDDRSRLELLRSNVARFRRGMEETGWELLESPGPIVPVMLRDDERAARVAAALRGRGIFAAPFSYPVVPRGTARIRVQISAAHTDSHIDAAIDAFAEAARLEPDHRS
ncbi:aminotransferase class I/II-fold pyridoxal phosphate-dependent enzyme [Nocardioides carbamazepini]|uniref:aminotransferase class I/II-fold pyridoxal phosphate-dependent enzyme n=1 Tax=Nocardioides carbamazepini TaxID=2854259 RepID=UPI00214A23A8|nr:aminotransferase class I/II-fold pyridoxal phosphate-dependent enzyme [Nocardioides carbamazepini]MCR1783442.1 aminotransferase class I/II-fold pyridoxal phosphate-dependent enzyme [Nocardioides carbamazepini]